MGRWPDGFRSRRQRPDPWHFGGEGIVHDGQLLVPGGVVGSGVYDSTAAIWRSADGVNWVRTDLDGSFVARMTQLPDGTLVAVASTPDARDDTGRVWTSTNGIDWQVASDIGRCCLQSFATTPQGIVGVGWPVTTSDVGDQALVATSADGLGWSVSTIQGSLQDVIVSTHFGVVMVGSDPQGRPGLIIGWPIE